jgi:hypothetical protein
MTTEYVDLAAEQMRLAKRCPEYRLWGPGPIRLRGIVDGYAVVRRPGSALFLMALRSYGRLPLCDKEGAKL